MLPYNYVWNALCMEHSHIVYELHKCYTIKHHFTLYNRSISRNMNILMCPMSLVMWFRWIVRRIESVWYLIIIQVYHMTMYKMLYVWSVTTLCTNYTNAVRLNTILPCIIEVYQEIRIFWRVPMSLDMSFWWILHSGAHHTQQPYRVHIINLQFVHTCGCCSKHTVYI